MYKIYFQNVLRENGDYDNTILIPFLYGPKKGWRNISGQATEHYTEDTFLKAIQEKEFVKKLINKRITVSYDVLEYTITENNMYSDMGYMKAITNSHCVEIGTVVGIDDDNVIIAYDKNDQKILDAIANIPDYMWHDLSICVEYEVLPEKEIRITDLFTTCKPSAANMVTI